LEAASRWRYSPADYRRNTKNSKKRRRLAFAIAIILAGAGAAALVLFALKDNVLYFYSPSDVSAKHVSEGVTFRIGGLVEADSLKQGPGADVAFVVTDGKEGVPVQYRGVLPALFREGQGVVALGKLGPGGVFTASEVLAKHDEKYMPPEVVESLKRSGRWKEGE
jgi:cytochrome c-type biogenesis protein CcmE